MRRFSGCAVLIAFMTLLAGCVHHTFAPGPGMSSLDFEPEAAQCRLLARGATPGFGVEASGSPKFVAAYTAGALIGHAIGSAIQENMNFNDCMQARGWRVADGAAAVPEASLAPTPAANITTTLAPTATPLAPSSATVQPTTRRRPLLIRAVVVTPAIAESANLGRSQGIAVQEVFPGGAAASAGIRPGDIILAFNGSQTGDAAGFQRVVSAIAPGDTVSASIWRNRAERAIEIHF